MTTPALPAGACDCHTHVVGPRADWPMLASRHYTPAPASVEDLQAHLSRCGLERVVVVQPSVYGVDNRCLVDALTRFGGRARGVAVLDVDASDDALDRLHERGVRGLRLNLESVGERDPDGALDTATRWSARLARLGWHLQLFAAFDTLAALVARRPPDAVPLVLDHFAMVDAALEPDQPRMRSLLRALAAGGVWIKLSAPYRLAPGNATRPAASATAALARRWAEVFVETAPRRVLWASDWPHTARTPGRSATEVSAYRAVSSDALVASIDDWLPSAEDRRRVLVDNPRELYGF